MSTIQIVYSLTVSGQVSSGTLETAMEDVPVDTEWLEFWGLRVTSDVTGIVGSVISRTIQMATFASSLATFALTTASNLPGPLRTIAVTAAGEDYVRPPVIAPAGAGSGGALQCWLTQIDTTIVAGGSGYSAATKIVASGGQVAFGGTLPTLTPTIMGNAITGVTVVDGGSFANVPFSLAAVDSGGGTGAILTARMGVGEAKILSPGGGYSAPTVSVAEFFNAMTTNGALATSSATLESTVSSFMLASLQAATNSPIGVAASIS